MASEEKVSPYVELANRALYAPRTGWFDRAEEFLPQLRGRRQAELYREMAENDALVGAILFAIEMVLRQVKWEVEPARSKDGMATPDDIERADFLATCRDDMSHSWEEVISDALTMLPYGHAYLEIVYKRRATEDIGAPAEKRTRYPDGRVGWRKFTLVPQHTIEDWDLDDHGGVRAVWQGGRYGEERVRIPIGKALLFRTSRNSPRGRSVLRRVVEAWYYRKKIREVEGIGIERDLAGLPHFTVDIETLSNAARKAEYENIIRNLRRDEQEGVITPGVKDESGELKPLAKLELLSSAGSRQFDTSAIINRYGREIAVALLQDVVLLGHEKIGTQALASEKRDLSDTALQAWLNDIAAIFNTHAIPRLFALNGESLENLPQLVPGELRSTDVEEFAAAIKDLASGGISFAGIPEAEAEAARRVGFKVPDEHWEQVSENGGPPEPNPEPEPVEE